MLIRRYVPPTTPNSVTTRPIWRWGWPRSWVRSRGTSRLSYSIVGHTGVCEKVEIAGPGFINLYLSDECIVKQLVEMVGRSGSASGQAAQPSQRIVVDYSSPNVAKEMHVGHLRSTVIGDCIARVLAFQGHHVIRQNHIGDWGTQFGMLIEFLLRSSNKTSLRAKV